MNLVDWELALDRELFRAYGLSINSDVFRGIDLRAVKESHPAPRDGVLVLMILAGLYDLDDVVSYCPSEGGAALSVP